VSEFGQEVTFSFSLSLVQVKFNNLKLLAKFFFVFTLQLEIYAFSDHEVNRSKCRALLRMPGPLLLIQVSKRFAIFDVATLFVCLLLVTRSSEEKQFGRIHESGKYLEIITNEEHHFANIICKKR
jgi:hypothetical protein